jgi:colanic acid/amylovoran biosynthesis protein
MIKRILLLNSTLQHLNAGDAAMLCVAAERFRELFPGVEIRSFTESAERLRILCPNVTPVELDLGLGNRFSCLPRHCFRHGYRLQELLRPWGDIWLSQFGKTWRFVANLILRGRPEHRNTLNTQWEEVREADLVVCTGGGYVTDEFEETGYSSLLALLLASTRGKAIGMVGQGLGPLHQWPLIQLARAVFPRIDFLGLREGLSGLKIAYDLGIHPGNATVTGDDAIELAYNLRPERVGDMLGFNVRLAAYAGLVDQEILNIREAVATFAARNRSTLIPIPISRYKSGDDLTSFHQLFPNTLVDPALTTSGLDPVMIARLAGRCRVVVTGSYHAGVFALAQGIPVIGIAKSDYYVDKFQGLANQFGAGVRVIRISRANPADLTTTIDELWQAAPQLRSNLLIAAANQVRAGHAFYQQIGRKVNTAHTRKAPGARSSLVRS